MHAPVAMPPAGDDLLAENTLLGESVKMIHKLYKFNEGLRYGF